MGALLATVLLLVLATSPPLQAESVLNFPRLSHEPDSLTGIAIVNPTGSEATLTIVAYGEDGLPLAGIINPASLQIPPNQQLALLTTELFGNDLDSESVAWFQARSPVDDLTGFFLFLNSTATLFDGADLPPTADSIVFNQVRSGSGFSTELNVINPSAGDANLVISIQGGGVTPQTEQVFLPSMGVARLDIFNLFGIGEVGAGAFVQVDSNVRVGGFQFIRQDGGDLQGLNARDASEQLTSLYFPQMTVLGPWVTEMGLVNYSAQSVIATISAYTADGALFDATALQTNPVTRALAPGESLLEDVATMFGFKGTDVQDGWIQVEATSPSLNGFISYGLPSVGSVATVAATAAVRQGIFSHIATLGGLFTGVAILNPAHLSTDVRVLAIQPDGTVLGSHSTVLLPGQRVSKLINELVPEANDQGGGLIWVKSDAPVYLTSLFGSDQILANIPSQPSPDAYQPDANLPLFQLSPTLTILQPSSSHTFQVVGSESAPIWRVDGEKGGNAESGSITAQGIYTAPVVAPEGVITITAEADGQSTGASVDILEKSAVLESQTVVQSVAYLGSLQSLYTAELALLGGFASGQIPSKTIPTQGETVGTQIFQLSPSGVRKSVLQLTGETVTKLVSYTASNEQEFLLVAAETSGRIYRMDPSSLALVEVAAGLNQPSAIALDEASGDLFVAERDRISVIPKDNLEIGVGSQSVLAQVGGGEGTRQLEVTAAEDARGVAVNNCTGDLFFTSRKTGEIKVYSSVDGVSVVVSGLRLPTRLLATYREGVPCPESFHLLVIEEGTDRILLVLPSAGLATVWASGRQSTDLAFLPPGNPFAAGQAIMLSEAPEEKPIFQVSVVPVADVYEEKPDVTEVKSTRVLAIPDQTAEAGTKVLVPVGLNEGSGITALAFLLEFDPELLELGVVQGGNLLTDHQVESEVSKGRAEIVVQSPASESLRSGAGDLVELVFVLRTSGISKLVLSQAKAAGQKGSEILLATRSGTLGDQRVAKEEEKPVVRVLSAPQLTPAPNGQVIVPVQLSDGSGVTDLSFVLIHDPNVLRLNTVQAGNLLLGHVFDWDGTDGKVAFKVASTKGQSMNPGSGSVVELVFDVAPSGSSPLGLSNAFGVGLGGTSVDLGTTSGIVIVTEAPGTLEIPSIEASPGEKTVVSIALNQTEDIAILQFELLYDPTVLEPLDALPGSLFRDHILKYDFSQKGIIVLDIISYQLTPLAPGPGTVVDMIFGVLSAPQSNSSTPLQRIPSQRIPSFSPLRLGDILALDSRKSPVKLDATSGSIGEVATRILSAPTLSAVRGEAVKVPIELSPGQGVGLVEFELEFNPVVLAFGEAGPGTLLSQDHSVRASLKEPGVLAVAVGSETLASFANGSGSIAELFFKMHGFGTSPLTFLSSSAIDPAKNPLEMSTVDGSVGDGTEPPTTVGRKLSFSSAEANVGEVVPIEALLADGSGLAAVSFDLFYDPNILTFRDAMAGSLATDHAVRMTPGKGFVSIHIASPTLSSLAKGEGSIAKLSFEARRAGVSPLKPAEASALDTRQRPVRMTSEGGRVAVEATTEPPLPRRLLAPSLTAQPAQKLTVPIGIDNGENLAALIFSLKFNPEILGFVGAEIGELVTDHELSVARRDNTLALSLKSPSGRGMRAGPGSVVQIAFETRSGGTSPLALGSASAVDVNGTEVKVEIVSGKVVVEEPSVPRVLTLPEKVATVGETVLVPVGLNEGGGISALGLVLRWDSKLLRLGKVGPGSLLADHKIESSAAEGALKVAVASPTKASLREGKGTVLEIAFETVQVGKTPLAIESASAVGPEGRIVKLSASSGSVRIDEATRPPEPRHLSVTGRTVPDNESFSIPVALDNGEGISAIRFALKWDPSIVRFGKLTNGSLINAGQKVGVESSDGGVAVSIVSAPGSSLNPGKGTLVELGFAPVKAGKTEMALGGASASNPKGGAIEVLTSGGVIVVEETVKPPATRNLALPTITTDFGKPIEVPVSLNEGQGVASLQFVLGYDATILSFVGVKGGPLLMTDHVVASEGGKGELGISIKGSSSMNAGPGVVASIQFKSVAAGISGLTAPLASGVSTKGVAIKVLGAEGGVTVKPPPPPVLSAPTLKIAKPPESLTVQIRLSEGKGVDSLQFVLRYNFEIISFGKVVAGSLLIPKAHAVSAVEGEGSLTVTIKGSSSMGSGPGSVADIVFQVRGGVGSFTDLTLSEPVTDPPIKLQLVNGSVAIGG